MALSLNNLSRKRGKVHFACAVHAEVLIMDMLKAKNTKNEWCMPNLASVSEWYLQASASVSVSFTHRLTANCQLRAYAGNANVPRACYYVQPATACSLMVRPIPAMPRWH